MGSKQVGLRYCGGCNSRYDRVGFVNRFQKYFPKIEFVSAQAGISYPAVIVICGCPNRCADVNGISAPADGMIWVTGFEDLLPAREKLTAALAERPIKSLTLAEILSILPHRDPFLFVDSVSRLIPGQETDASFYVSRDHPVFAGHFPDIAVFPGVCIVEAMAQTADLMLLSTDRYAQKTPLFMGIRKAGFHRMVLPGDTMEIHVSLLEERAELGYALCKGQAFVAEELAADAELQLALR